MKTERTLRRRINTLTTVFIILLVLSGITAFPVQWEISLVEPYAEKLPELLRIWFDKIKVGIKSTNAHYPFLFYGTDWLAFSHLVIAVAFIGILKDPVRNIWILQFGMIACLMVFPLAFIAGPIRGIPFFWQCIDCSFGLFGIIPLYITYRYTKQLEKIQEQIFFK